MALTTASKLQTAQQGLTEDLQLLAEKNALRAQMVAAGADTTAIDQRIAQLQDNVAFGNAETAKYNQDLMTEQQTSASTTGSGGVIPGGGQITDPNAADYNANYAEYVRNTQDPGGTPYKKSVAFQQSPSGSMAGETGHNTEINDGSRASASGTPFAPPNINSNLAQNENLSDPRSARLANAGLNKGGVNSTKTPESQPWIRPGVSNTGNIDPSKDWRVRISLPAGSDILYKSPDGSIGFMEPLVTSGQIGVVFPYTPTITLAYNARYQEQALTHSNFKSYFYEGSDVAPITISGEFTAQNQGEAQYVLACVYFLRACTKMLWGQDVNAGTPPPIVKLNGYGIDYLPDVSCVITNFTHTMPAEVDYIAINRGGYNGARMPVSSTISVTLQPVYSRKKIANDFTVSNYGAFGGNPAVGRGGRFL